MIQAIEKFYDIEKLSEKNEWFQSFIITHKLNQFSEDIIWELINISFQLFKLNFESNNYQNYEYVADVCENLLNLYFKKKDWNKIVLQDEDLSFILDIICFVYELTYRYIEKAKILKKVIETTDVKKEIKIRALESFLSTNEPETRSYIEKEIKEYPKLLKQLKEKTEDD